MGMMHVHLESYKLNTVYRDYSISYRLESIFFLHIGFNKIQFFIYGTEVIVLLVTVDLRLTLIVLSHENIVRKSKQKDLLIVFYDVRSHMMQDSLRNISSQSKRSDSPRA